LAKSMPNSYFFILSVCSIIVHGAPRFFDVISRFTSLRPVRK
jgi:hypothetical protein